MREKDESDRESWESGIAVTVKVSYSFKENETVWNNRCITADKLTSRLGWFATGGSRMWPRN